MARFRESKHVALHCCRGDCGGVYVCALCGKLVGWCCGAHDDLDEQYGGICDFCADQIVKQRSAADDVAASFVGCA